MSKLKDEGSQSKFSIPLHGNITPALVSLGLGIVAGDKTAVIARVIQCWNGPNAPVCKSEKITELSLVFMVFLVALFIVGGGYAARRGWITHGPILVSVLAVVVAALFAVLDRTFPNPMTALTGESKLQAWEAFYHWLWILFLLVPALLLPNPRNSWRDRARNSLTLMSATFTALLVCGLAGYVLVVIARLVVDITGLESYTFQGSRKFWIAHPPAVNAISGALFVIAFSPFWWKNLWDHVPIMRKYLWLLLILLIATIQASLYSTVYDKRDWISELIKKSLAETWQLGLAFGAFPVVTVVAVFLVLRLSRRVKWEDGVRWPGSNQFWWLLSLGLVVGFALVATLGFGTLICLGANDQIWQKVAILSGAHAVNGAILGLSLWLAFWLASRRLMAGTDAMRDQGSGAEA